MMTRALALCAALLLVGCGEETVSVTVSLTHASDPVLDPYAPSVGLSKVRISVDGPTAADDVAAEIDTEARSVSFAGLPPLESAAVQALGFDARGNIVAFARLDGVELLADADLTMPLRRNLAYVTHQRNSAQDNPQSVVYQIDLATRGLVNKVRLPGVAPTARSITARGGASLLLTVEDQGRGSVVQLSAQDHSMTSITLPVTQQVTYGVAGSPTGVVVGGGQVNLVDLDGGGMVEEVDDRVGGRVLDGVMSLDGRRAIVVVDVSPGVLDIDIVNRTVKTINALPDAGGVALSPDGRVAYVTSLTSPRVAAVDMSNGRVRVLNGFAEGVGEAVYADELDSVLAVRINSSNGSGRVLGFIAPFDTALDSETAVKTLFYPTGIASDGSGRRAIVVAAGTSTQTAGLTVIETTATTLPQGASALYPTDPDDRFFDGPLSFGQRYQPSDVAVVYGR